MRHGRDGAPPRVGVERWRTGVGDEQALVAAVVGVAQGGVDRGLQPEPGDEQPVDAARPAASARAGRRSSRRARPRRRRRRRPALGRRRQLRVGRARRGQAGRRGVDAPVRRRVRRAHDDHAPPASAHGRRAQPIERRQRAVDAVGALEPTSAGRRRPRSASRAGSSPVVRPGVGLASARRGGHGSGAVEPPRPRSAVMTGSRRRRPPRSSRSTRSSRSRGSCPPATRTVPSWATTGPGERRAVRARSSPWPSSISAFVSSVTAGPYADCTNGLSPVLKPTR